MNELDMFRIKSMVHAIQTILFFNWWNYKKNSSKLEALRKMLESKDFKISMSTEYMECRFNNKRKEDNGTINIKSKEVPNKTISVT